MRAKGMWRIVRVCGLVVCLVSVLPQPVASQTVEYFVQSEFAAAVGSRNIIGFDVPGQANAALIGSEYDGCGLTIVQRDGGDINVVGNTAPGAYGANTVTEVNIDSQPNALSSSILVGGVTQDSDNFDFVFTEPTSAAGLVVGNLGHCAATNTTIVQFLDGMDFPIAMEVLGQANPDVVWGAAPDVTCGGQSPMPLDNRVFYGVVTSQSIAKIRVLNDSDDGDNITLDAIQFSSEIISSCGFESGEVCLSMYAVD